MDVFETPPPHLHAASLSSVSLTPPTTAEGGAASLGARAVPNSTAAAVVVLLPAGVPGGCDGAVSFPTPTFHRLHCCSTNR